MYEFSHIPAHLRIFPKSWYKHGDLGTPRAFIGRHSLFFSGVGARHLPTDRQLVVLELTYMCSVHNVYTEYIYIVSHNFIISSDLTVCPFLLVCLCFASFMLLNIFSVVC